MTSPLNPNLPADLPPIRLRRIVYLEANRAPTILDTKYRDGSYYENNTEWRDNSVSPPDIWKLAKVNSKVNATWFKITGAPSGTVITLSDTANTKVGPDGTGNIQLVGTAGQIDIVSNPGSNLLTFSLHGGGEAVDSFQVQSVFAPGVNPVIPDGTGLVTFSANVIAQSGTPLQTVSRAINSMVVELQISAANATTDATKNGISHFYSGQFSVDANGFVQLVGGSAPALQKLKPDAHTAPGTDPVIPDGSGQIILTGAQVASGTIGANAIRTDSLAANSATIEIQRSAASASSSVNNNGISSYSTDYFTIDSNGYVKSTNGLIEGFSNLGMTYSGGTFTMTDSKGAALSASNPAYVTIRSKSVPGTVVQIAVTAPQTFVDNIGTSTIAGNLFRFVNAQNYSAGVPFFIYAILDSAETTVNFAICRMVNLNTTGLVATLGAKGTTGSSTYASMFLFGDPAPTLANFASQPCLRIGQIIMTKVGGGANDWQVSTLDPEFARISLQLLNQTVYNFPTGVFGASASTFFIANGGTAPVFNDVNTCKYSLEESGLVNMFYSCRDSGGGGSAGLGAVLSQIAAPFPVGTTTAAPCGYGRLQTGSYNVASLCLEVNTSTFFEMCKTTDLAGINNADWTAAGKAFDCQIQFIPLATG